MGLLFSLETQFYHSSIRRYVALFGSLFSDLYVKRKSDDGREDNVKVPIRYGNKNVFMGVAQDGSRETTKVSRILPAMAFELTSIYKDVERKTNPMNMIKNSRVEADGSRKYQFNSVPYNFMFNLHIRSKNMDDMLQIVEQIVPAFDGNLSVTIEDIPNSEVDVERDIKIRMDELDIDDNYQDEMMSRLIDYTITFELKGYLYKRTLSSMAVKEIELIGGWDFGDGVIEEVTLLDLTNQQTPIQGESLNFFEMSPQVDNQLYVEAPEPKKVRRTRKAKE